MKRLRKKFASKPIKILESFITAGGLFYAYQVRLLNNKPFYSITCDSAFDSSSLYDGDDFEKSFELFCELAIALKGISYAENFAKTKLLIKKDLDDLVEKQQDMILKVKPLFLGDSDFPNV